MKCYCGKIIARLGVYLGDETNNEAEYQGALYALMHIRSMHPRRAILYVDSLLVAKQIAGQWACRAPHLMGFYEQALDLVELLRQDERLERFEIKHVYREYNADADATANETIDRFQTQAHQDGVIIQENWLPTVVPDLMLAILNAERA